jgi:hypothetical protein
VWEALVVLHLLRVYIGQCLDRIKGR